MELKQHPLSAAFPAMSDADFSALVEDVRANGQREPIMLFEGMVLDGWHRYRACIECGVEPTKFKFDGGDPVAFVLSHNLHRRHLSASQRAAAVVACAEWTPSNIGRPRGEARVETISTLAKTNAEMAKAAQVTPRTITDAKAAHKAGLSEPVKSGAMTAHEAAAVARGKTEPQKPATKAKREIVQRPADIPQASNDDALAEAQHAVRELAEENERLSDRLAVEAMDASEEEKTQAAETIAELRARVRTLEAELSAVKASRDTYMRESREKESQIAYWRKKVEKVERAAA